MARWLNMVPAMVNLGEDREEQSGVDRPSSSDTTASSSEYNTGQSSGNFTSTSSALASSSSSPSSVYHSTRIQSMIDNRSRFISQVEFDVEYGKDHWSELVDSGLDIDSIRLANREHFEKLKNHPQWGGFFKSVKVVVGKKINEGAQAVIYDAKVEFEDGRRSPGYGYYVVKVMKGVCPLQQFQKQWPVGMLCNASKERVKGPLMWIEGGTLLDDRFAFVMLRQWGDLRNLIDLKMQLNFKKVLVDQVGPELPFEDEELFEVMRGCMCSRCNEITSHLLQSKENVTRSPNPPFENLWFIKKVMLCIARGRIKLPIQN